MNQDMGIRLQAYLDGELKGAEREGMERQLASDAELRALAQEIRAVTAALKDSDPIVTVPASREFYFSQIERRIAAAEVQESRTAGSGVPVMVWVRRALLPLTGVALATFMLMSSVNTGVLPIQSPLDESLQATQRVEETGAMLEETGAMTFRSESEGVTLVWLYDKDQPSGRTLLDDE